MNWGSRLLRVALPALVQMLAFLAGVGLAAWQRKQAQRALTREIR